MKKKKLKRPEKLKFREKMSGPSLELEVNSVILLYINLKNGNNWLTMSEKLLDSNLTSKSFHKASNSIWKL